MQQTDGGPSPESLVEPFGGQLVDLYPPKEERERLRVAASRLPSLQLSDRSVCDLELLANGGFSPLTQFLGKEDHDRVVHEMRLADGTLWPIPITLPVSDGAGIPLHSEIALRSSRNDLLAIMRVDEIYEWDPWEVARSVFGTEDTRHPLVAEMQHWGRFNIAGPLKAVAPPPHYDFKELRLTPSAVRRRLEQMGRQNVVAFQTRNPLHRAHEELTRRATAEVDGVLLLHPSVGITKPGDVDHYTRVRTYKVLTDRYYDRDRVVLALLPLAMRMAGPREALWHAMIRRNFGANFFIVGRDHASPGGDSSGKPFYGPYAAQDMLEQYRGEIGVTPVTFKEFVYLPDQSRYEEGSRVPAGTKTVTLSGTQVRDDYLNRGRTLPEWFTRPEVAKILRDAYPPRHKQGVCIWFTGLSSSGKSTTAEVLITLLLESGRQATLLDGDVVRTHLSKGLGFSKEDRDTNIRRIGFVASEIVRHGGMAVAAAVSPYRSTRNEVRHMMPADAFVEVFVDTPIEVCEQRDPKGMYAKARRGEIKDFTGINDPYEAPLNAEVVVETTGHSAEENARLIIAHLMEKGFVRTETE